MDRKANNDLKCLLLATLGFFLSIFLIPQKMLSEYYLDSGRMSQDMLVSAKKLINLFIYLFVTSEDKDQCYFL